MLFPHPWGELPLQRWPRQSNNALQAWDSADRYLLRTLSERRGGDEGLSENGAHTLVVNDQFGALALACISQGQNTLSMSDSWVAQQACRENAKDCGLLPPTFLDMDAPISDEISCVLLRVPKSVALLEYQLHALSSSLAEGTPVWLAGMDKHLPRQVVPLLERYFGNGRAEYGWKKARLFSANAPGKVLAKTPYPSRVDSPFGELTVHAGVFSQQQLDIGARFFLSHLPTQLSDTARVADLGCGNGVIGLAVLARFANAHVTFCDESYLALKSAQDNWQQYGADAGENGKAHFHWGDGLAGLDQRFDLILLNPPFHEGHVVGDHVARRLFKQAKKALSDTGELRVIGNRHLGYHATLKKVFPRVEEVASNRKFVVWSCRL